MLVASCLLSSSLQLLEKLKKEWAATAEPVAAASSSGPGDARKVALRLPPPPPCFTDVLTVSKLTVGWGQVPSTPTTPQEAAAANAARAAAESSPGSVPAPVLSDVSFTIRKGQRVLVLGPNGAGKSTLLKCLAGRLQLWAGSVSQGEGVKMGEWVTSST